MTARLTAELPGRLLNALRSGCPALLLTVGADGLPASAFTWAAAPDATRLRFAADQGTATLANLQREKRAALQIIAPDNLVYLVKGETTLLAPRIAAAPFDVALMEMRVREVKDQSWPGVAVRALGYDWAPAEREARLKMERAVYAEMLAWNG